MQSVGSRINELRKSYKLTQQDLGDIVGLHGTNIGRIENGQVLPASDILLKLSIYFQVSCDYLLTGKDAISQKCNIADNYDNKMIELFHQLNNSEKEFFIEQLEFTLFKKKKTQNVKLLHSQEDNNSSGIT